MAAITLGALYVKMRRYIRWLSSVSATDSVLLQQEDIQSELAAELIHGFLYYEDSITDGEELIRIVKQMLHNRVGELIYKFHITHRKEEVYQIDIDSLAGYEDTDDDGTRQHLGSFVDEILDNELNQTIPDPQELAEYSEEYTQFIALLTPPEMEIVNALLNEDPRVRQQIVLTGMRKSFVYEKPKVSVNYKIVADALHLDRAEAFRLWTSIKSKWRRLFS
jgi:hypothetical protein